MRWLTGIDYQPGFLSPTEARGLLESLASGLDWRQRDVVLFGKRVPQPRLTAWCSDPGVRYTYSGLRLEPCAWHPALAGLRERLAKELDYPFNSVLANAYRDGQDSMGWHADDEPELGPEPLIASVSLGASRRFRVRPHPGRVSDLQPRGLDLAPGSLLVMRGQSQALWQHCVPKTKKAVGLRINLTFRRVRARDRRGRCSSPGPG